jgi:hypothetical protein
VDEYAAVADPAFADEVVAHAAEHVRAFVLSARRGRPPEGEELDFVRSCGAQRARELMPLDALLEAYLIGQRTVWEAIVAAAGDSPEGMRAGRELTGLTFADTHAINVAVADAYLRESRALASEAERSRRDLLDRLLSGREPGPDEARRAEGSDCDRMPTTWSSWRWPTPPTTRCGAPRWARVDAHGPGAAVRGGPAR